MIKKKSKKISEKKSNKSGLFAPSKDRVNLSDLKKLKAGAVEEENGRIGEGRERDT